MKNDNADAMDRLVRSLSGAGLSTSEFCVLVDLGLYAVVGKDRPTTAEIADHLGRSESTVRRVLRSLVEKGWLADAQALPEVAA